MTDHDDLDRKIRALLGRASNDSPEPMEIRPLVVRAPFRRWPAVAAALVLVAGVAVIARHDSGRSSSAPGTDASPPSAPPSTNSETNLTTVPSAVTSTASPASSTTVPTTRDCAAVAPANYDAFGTIHTISPNSQPVDVTITADSGSWCAGGNGSVLVTFHNRSRESVTVDRPTLILASNGPAKWDMGELRASLTLAPDERVSIPAAIVAPPAPPGDYTIAVYGFLNSNVPITIEGLVVCDGSMLSVSVRNLGSASGNVRTDVTVKNITAVSCILARPANVLGLTKAHTTATPIEFTQSTYLGDPPGAPLRILAPDHSATLWLDSTITGVCGTPSSQWTLLDLNLAFDAQGAAIPVQVESPGKPFDTGCGLGVSAWGQPD